MKTLLVNLKAFLLGFGKLRTLKYKKGWNQWTFGLLYLVDYGTHVLTGAAVVSWSRWFWENRRKYKWAAFMNRLLNHLDDDHGEESGPALWGTVDCGWRVRVGLCVFWLVAMWSLL